MPDLTIRPTAQRKADALARLSTRHQDAWVATADGGAAHLVPLSIAWVDERLVIALDGTSVTARNLAATVRARVAVGPTRDVVVADVVLEATLPVADAGEVGEAYAAQADWDPRASGGTYQYLVLAPRRIQAWREADEIAGRTIMRDGAWVV
ncbi:pyridoxamine 5'-phosphate oxidase family protein [Antribacter gilvus]|uniref:pyridoxamine 5'-phosphate oxidase family protein n=1 Tax=Antribacter gilvus TaxID=2304675 RepID=UPI000F79A6C0|nr:pyridoxamine 5'-phosphate oxidase family protein [Antribacter gilvus]